MELKALLLLFLVNSISIITLEASQPKKVSSARIKQLRSQSQAVKDRGLYEAVMAGQVEQVENYLQAGASPMQYHMGVTLGGVALVLADKFTDNPQLKLRYFAIYELIVNATTKSWRDLNGKPFYQSSYRKV